MKILFSAITYYPTIGGADDYVRSLAEGLARRGHEVTVVASDLERHVEGVRLADTSPCALNGVRVRRCRSFNLPGHLYPFWPGLHLAIHRLRPDLIHAFGLGYFSVDGAARWRRELPVVVSPTGGRYRRGRLYEVLRRLFLPETERVARWTALSLDERRRLDHDHPGHPPCPLLSPSLDPAEWSEELPDPFPGVPRGRRVLFCGRFARDKGIDDLRVAFAQVRQELPAELILVGPDYGLEQLPEGDGVHVLGALPRRALLAAYQHADLLVLPSYHEGFGIVLLEAMAAGLPVIGYDNSAIPELVRDGENGILVPTGDYRALAGAIRSLLANRERAAACGRAGRKRAFAEFSRDRMLDQALAIYGEALAAGAARR